MNRIEKCLCMVDRNGLGMEVGPSYAPVAPKRHGFKVHTIDHASREELMQKYANTGANIDAIEEVDFIWKGEPLSQLVGNPGAYDYIIASDVVEHIPDLISFFRDCSALLKPSGILTLIIPDKRFCFDVFRWPSSTGDLLQAYAERRKLHTPGTAFDHISLAAKLNGVIGWDRASSGKIEFVHPFEYAVSMWDQSLKSTTYIDLHQ